MRQEQGTVYLNSQEATAAAIEPVFPAAKAWDLVPIVGRAMLIRQSDVMMCQANGRLDPAYLNERKSQNMVANSVMIALKKIVGDQITADAPQFHEDVSEFLEGESLN